MDNRVRWLGWGRQLDVGRLQGGKEGERTKMRWVVGGEEKCGTAGTSLAQRRCVWFYEQLRDEAGECAALAPRQPDTQPPAIPT